jgi:hypothetical protein
MTNPFAVDAGRSLSAARSSVQSSLFGQLRTLYPGSRSAVAWCVVHAAWDESPKREESLAALAARPLEERKELLAVARVTLDRAKTPEWKALATAIVATLRSLSASPTSIAASAAVLLAQEDAEAQAQVDAYNASLEEAVRLFGVGVTPAQRSALQRSVVMRGLSSADAVAELRAAEETG